MNCMRAFLAMALLLVAGSASAQLEPWNDYEVSDSVWNVTTIKVHANMIDDYLEGIEQSWVGSNEVAKKLGQIEDYWVYLSDLPLSGDFNVLLVVKFKASADLAPSKERYAAFMKEWGEAREQRNRELTKNYPGMREITGEYQLRRVTFK